MEPIQVVVESSGIGWIKVIAAAGQIAASVALAAVALAVWRVQLNQHRLERARFHKDVLERLFHIDKGISDVVTFAISSNSNESEFHNLYGKYLELWPLIYAYLPDEIEEFYNRLRDYFFEMQQIKKELLDHIDEDGHVNSIAG